MKYKYRLRKSNIIINTNKNTNRMKYKHKLKESNIIINTNKKPKLNEI